MGRHSGRGVGRRKYVKNNKRHCDYHLCTDAVGEIKKCPYCGRSFCEKHIQPKPSSVLDLSNASYEELQNWRREDAHPCYRYAEHYQRMKEQETDAIRASLDRMNYSSHFWGKREGSDTGPANSSSYGPKQARVSKESIPSYGRAIDDLGRKLSNTALLPFLWIYGALRWLFVLLIYSPITWLNEEIGKFLYHLTKGFRHFFSASWALLKVLLFLLIIYYAFNFILSSGILSTGADFVKDLRVPLPIYKNCIEGLNHGDCSINKPFYCDNGNLVERADICGCDRGHRANGTECIQKIICPDGTFWPDCSPNKPYQCDRGELINNSKLCGCPADYAPDGDGCKKIQRCADGTIYGQCTSRKPLYCQNGSLIENATHCGCPSGFYAYGNQCQDPTSPDIQRLEGRVHELINVQRAAHGLSELTLDSSLTLIARKHSEDMATNDYFDHVNLKGLDPTGRGNEVGYSCSKNYGTYYTMGIAENIFQTSTYTAIWYTNGVETSRDYPTLEQMANQVVDGWMNSPGHRQNILTSTYDREGIGVSISNDGKVYITEDFC